MNDDDFTRFAKAIRQKLDSDPESQVEEEISRSESNLSSDQRWILIESVLRKLQKLGRPIDFAFWRRRFPEFEPQIARLIDGSALLPAPPSTGSPSATLSETLPSKPSPTGGSSVGPSRVSREASPSLKGNRKLESGSRFGKYEIIEVLGRGGMGIVYKARDTESDRNVALKTIHTKAGITDDVARRFSREARLASKIDHPNIVAALDAGEIDGKPYLALEYVPGKNLSDLVHDAGPLPTLTAVNYILQAAKGIGEAHQLGIIHRDIKPSNILLHADLEQIKVLDLGLARVETILDDATRSSELTSTGAMFGTVDYMAPEQARDSKRADARADIYSLGCTLYYLLKGSTLYPGDSILNKIRQHRDAPIPILSQLDKKVPAVLQATFNRMVAKEPQDRFASMKEVIESLELAKGVLEGSKADVLSATLKIKVKYKPNSQKSTKAWLIPSLLGVVAILGIVGSVAYLLRPKSPAVGNPVVVDLKDGESPQDSTIDDTLTAPIAHESVRSLAWDWPEDAPAPAKFPFESEQSQQTQQAWATFLKVPAQQINSIGLELRLIPPGEFTRGSNGDIFGLAMPGSVGLETVDATRPPTEVRITRPFLIGIHEVTQAQFQQFVEATGYQTTAETSNQGGWFYNTAGNLEQKPEFHWKHTAQLDGPVVFVSRQDAEAFCGWLSQIEKGVYRLPTEAEWEFACRAGSNSRFGHGDSLEVLEPFVWANEYFPLPADKRPSLPLPHSVGKKQPNAFGLYDMLGNVWEFCADGYAADSYRTAAHDNPVFPSYQQSVLRGGSVAEAWPTSNPYSRGSDGRPQPHIGFRVVQELSAIESLEPLGIVKLPDIGQPLGKRANVSSPPPIPGLRSWSIETVGFRGGIAAIDYSPSAKLVAASSSTDPVIRVYDEKLNLQRVLVGPAGNVSGIEFSPDGKYVAAACWGSDWDNGVRIWEVSTGRNIYHDNSGQWAPRVHWSPDGQFLAYPQNATTRIVDIRTLISHSVYGSHDHEFCWAPDGKRFAVRDNTWKIRIYSANTWNKLQDVELAGAHYSGPMNWSPDGKWFAALSDGGDIKLLDGVSFAELKVIQPKQAVSQFLWSSDSNRLVLTGSQAIVWDVVDNKQQGTIPVNGVASWFAKDASLVFGRSDGLLEIRSLDGALQSRSADRGRPLTGTALLSPDGSEIVTRVGSDLLFWSSETGEAKDSFANAVLPNSELCWSPDGKHIATWADKTLQLIQRSDGKKRAECVGHDAGIYSCNWAHDGSRLISASMDKTLRLWDSVSGKEISKQTYENAPYDAAWSHDGKSLAIIFQIELVFASPDASTIISRHRTIGDYAYRAGSSHGLAWSPDDSRLTTGSYHDRLIVWNVAERNWERVFHGQLTSPFANSQAWSPDGTQIVASTTYQDAVLIDLVSGKSTEVLPCWNGQWMPDSKRFLAGLSSYQELYGYDAEHHQRTGILIPAVGGVNKQSLCISADGHVRGPSSAVVYVALTDDGQQRTYRQADFEKRYAWRNDPAKATLLRPVQPTTVSAMPSTEVVIGAKPSNSSAAPIERDPSLSLWLPQRLVTRPQPIESLENWTIETVGHRGAVYDLSYHPDGKFIASVGEDGNLRIWDTDCRLVGILIDSIQPIRVVSWSREGDYLATAGDDRTLRIWDVREQKLLRRIPLPYVPVGIRWQPSGEFIAIEGRGGTVRMRTATGDIDEIANHVDNGVHLCDWSPDGKSLAVALWGEFVVVNAESLAVERRMPVASLIAGLATFAWSPDGKTFIGNHGENSARLGFWDALTGAYDGEANVRCVANGTKITCSSDGRRMIAGGTGRHFFDVTNHHAISSILSIYNSAILSPDGTQIAALVGTQIAIVDPVSGIESGRSSAIGSAGGYPVASLSVDGKKLFVNSASELWTIDPEIGRVIDRIPFENFQKIIVSPASDLVAAKSENHLRVVRVSDRRIIPLVGHAGYIYSAAWSLDGQMLASMDSQKFLRIWNPTTGENTQTVELPVICDFMLRWQSNNAEIALFSSAGISVRVEVATGKILEQQKVSAPLKSDLDQLFPDSDRRLSLEPGGEIRIRSKSLNRDLGHLLTNVASDQSLCIGPTGHWQGPMISEQLIRYIGIDTNGRQTAYSPKEFATRFQWKNNPAEATLAEKLNEPDPSPVPPAIPTYDQDRRVAEMVLRLNGWVRVRLNGANLAVYKREAIPAEPFEVRDIELGGTLVTDEELTLLSGLGSLRHLGLSSCQKITDVALIKIGKHPHLKSLGISNSSLTEAGVKLDGFSELTTLVLDGLPITDRIANELAKTPRLQDLSLGSTPISDTLAECLMSLKDLRSLSLPVGITDEALLQFGERPIQSLALSGDKITDRSARIWAGFKKLKTLSLSGTQVGDETFEALTQIQLQTLSVDGKKLTEQGANALLKMRDLTTLSLSHTELKDGHLRVISQMKGLRSLSLSGNNLTTPEGIASFRDMTYLNSLALAGIMIDDVTLSRMLTASLLSVSINNCPGLSGEAFGLSTDSALGTLHLTGGEFKPATLVGIGKLKRLSNLSIDGILLTPEVTASLEQLPVLQQLSIGSLPTKTGSQFGKLLALEYVYLNNASFQTADDIRSFSSAPRLNRMHIYKGGITADHLHILQGMPALKLLTLQDCKIPKDAFEALKVARPDLKLEVISSQIE